MLSLGRANGVAATLAVILGLTALVGETASKIAAPAPVAPALDRTKSQMLLAQADDLASPPSPDTLVTAPPPAPLTEAVPAPFPGYAWEPGHWAWDGTQYGWLPGRYIVQPTNGATFTPGYWQQYSGGWAWVEGRWSWGTQGEGE